MKYISTRDNYRPVPFAEAIRLGMVPSGGLFVPEKIPELSCEDLDHMVGSSYRETAFLILQEYLTDFSEGEIKGALARAYNSTNFDNPEIAPLHKLTSGQYILELWHGPTAAFKDVALQLMPHLLKKALKKLDVKNELVILTATSGDTGKAALEGFRDVEGIKIIVFYPEQGVSKVQKRQMITTSGENTAVVGVEGNFDNCQTQIKNIFADKEFKEQLQQSGFEFSSANSINWGRLVPQIVYYFYSYAELCRREEIEPGALVNITVPTGNFGNILAGYYAFRMGLPVKKFICASNDNNILTDFMQSGLYDTDRKFKKTISPSMDILISSNLERFLFEITDHQSELINEWYNRLLRTGKFEIDQKHLTEINKIMAGVCSREPETKKTIHHIYQKYNYIVDPHTAVGIKSYQKYRAKSGDRTPVIIDSTASPFKFSPAVMEALEGELKTKDEFAILKKLAHKTGSSIHPGLQGLETEKIRHDRSCSVEGIKGQIKEILRL